MKVLSALANILLLITLSGCVMVSAKNDAAGTSQEHPAGQPDSATSKPDTTPDAQPATQPKPAGSTAEPGCS